MQPDCSACGTQLASTRNPFFGTGQSVHEFMLECPRCGEIRFASGDHPAEVATLVKPSWWRRFWSRLTPSR